MRILGVDPGYATIGFGLVDAERGQVHMVTYGAITTPAGIPLSRRLYQIDRDMEELIGKLKPDIIAIEELFFNTNITTGIKVAEARGVIVCSAVKECAGLFEYTPSQIKLAITGSGKAEKHQVQYMTKMMLGLCEIPKPDDAADALAVALTHAQTNNQIKNNSMMQFEKLKSGRKKTVNSFEKLLLEQNAKKKSNINNWKS